MESTQEVAPATKGLEIERLRQENLRLKGENFLLKVAGLPKRNTKVKDSLLQNADKFMRFWTINEVACNLLVYPEVVIINLKHSKPRN